MHKCITTAKRLNIYHKEKQGHNITAFKETKQDKKLKRTKTSSVERVFDAPQAVVRMLTLRRCFPDSAVSKRAKFQADRTMSLGVRAVTPGPSLPTDRSRGLRGASPCRGGLTLQRGPHLAEGVSPCRGRLTLQRGPHLAEGASPCRGGLIFRREPQLSRKCSAPMRLCGAISVARHGFTAARLH